MFSSVNSTITTVSNGLTYKLKSIYFIDHCRFEWEEMNSFIIYCVTPKSIGVTHIAIFLYRKVFFLGYGVCSLFRGFLASKKALKKYWMFQGSKEEYASWNIQYLLNVLLLPANFLEKKLHHTHGQMHFST